MRLLWITLMCHPSHYEEFTSISPDAVPEEVAPQRGWCSQVCCTGLIAGVKLYQMTLRAFLGGHCRFEPSCSDYFIASVKKSGPWRGTIKGLWRICRCQPFCKGGYDPP